MQLLCVKSMRRNLPKNGTVALDRSLVNGCIISPAPPAIIIDSTLFVAGFFLLLKDYTKNQTMPIVCNGCYRLTMDPTGKCYRECSGIVYAFFERRLPVCRSRCFCADGGCNADAGGPDSLAGDEAASCSSSIFLARK